MKRFFVLVLCSLAATTALPAAVAASCIGPTIVHDSGELQAGDDIVVEGSGWGDNCYDTGPPPDGQGALGRPLLGIQIFLEQGDLQILVAEGDADSNYQFTARVVVPSALAPGKFIVTARSVGGAEARTQPAGPLALVDSEAVVEAIVVDFEVSSASSVEPAEADTDSWLLVIVGAAIAAALTAGFVAWRAIKLDR